MVRRIVIGLLLAVSLQLPARAARRVTVQQVDLLLEEYKGQSDGKVAAQLADMVLTERAPSARLKSWEAKFPGRRCHEILTELVDASSFEELPESDKLAQSAPDVDGQRTMLMKTVDYLNQALSRLPNFFATRRTEYYEDKPPAQTADHFDPGPGGRRSTAVPTMTQSTSTAERMHIVDQANVPVSYQDGYEMRGTKRLDPTVLGEPVKGLTTVGEFGPILAVVFPDAVRGKIYWGYWERGASGALAVYRYKVPASESRYLVQFPRGKDMLKVLPAYHGEISIDPESGAIMRITIVPDFAPPYELVKEGMMVEYGPVALGGTNYICPLKGVALAVMPMNDPTSDAYPAQTQLNDVAFTDYHLLRSESRIVPAQDAPPETAPPAGPPQ
jgi:hypothetical protein